MISLGYTPVRVPKSQPAVRSDSPVRPVSGFQVASTAYFQGQVAKGTFLAIHQDMDKNDSPALIHRAELVSQAFQAQGFVPGDLNDYSNLQYAVEFKYRESKEAQPGNAAPFQLWNIDLNLYLMRASLAARSSLVCWQASGRLLSKTPISVDDALTRLVPFMLENFPGISGRARQAQLPF